MNTRKNNIQMYAAFSLALLMALIGWRTLKARAAGGEPIAPAPVDVDSIENRLEKYDQGTAGEDLVIIDTDQADPPPTPILSDQEAILAALAEHFEMDESEFLSFEVKENTGSYVRGAFDNGYFLMANVEGEWVFVAGGHSLPNCNVVINYGFPTSMVPECPAAGNDIPDCEDVGITVATFIKDVSVADGSVMEPGQYFTKTWRIQNVGTCTWNSDYQFVFASGDQMGSVLSQPLTVGHVPPGGTIDVSVQMRAPEETGSYRGYWRFQDSQGSDFGLTSGGSVWVDIKVKEGSSDDEGSSGPYTGYPFIEILSVSQDYQVTIKGLNFPAQDKFNVMMNYYGTKGENGTVVESILTGDGGEFTDTFQIPTYLRGQSLIAIRLESPYSGYYAYNWFTNY